MLTIEIKRLNDNATTPTRGHATDAGLDLYASEDVSYRPGDVVTVPTGIALGVAPGFVGLVRDRSSVSKKGLKVTAGVVDAGYTGEVRVVLLNLSNEHGCVQKGQRIAQVLIIPVALPEVREVSTLGESSRGDKGFGSTGV